MHGKNIFGLSPDNRNKNPVLNSMGIIPTEAEQNRLIIDNSGLVEPIAAKFRGLKGIPFEDILAVGQAALVEAARSWRPVGPFGAYADKGIKGAIFDFVETWQEFVPLEGASSTDLEDDDAVFLEWDVWPHAAPYEIWNSLAATPEELILAYEGMRESREYLHNAMLSLPPRDRKIIVARFVRRPYQSIESIARDHRISYSRVIQIIDRVLRALRANVTAQRKNQTARPSPQVREGRHLAAAR